MTHGSSGISRTDPEVLGAFSSPGSCCKPPTRGVAEQPVSLARSSQKLKAPDL